MEFENYFSANAEYQDSSIRSMEGFDDLVKAMTAQEGVTDYVTLQGGGALMPQSLELTYAKLNWEDVHLKFQKDIGISKAYSTVEEFTLMDGYGSEGSWVDQLENPVEDDPEFFKDFAKIKFLRAMWRVGDVLGLTRTITDPYEVSIEASMYRNMRALEEGLYFGDDSIVPQEIVGLEKTLEDANEPDNIIDLRGNVLTQAIIKQAAELIHNNQGTPTKMYVSNSTLSTLGDILGVPASQRIVQNQDGSHDLGNPIGKFRSNFGDFPFDPNLFLNWETRGVPKIKNPANPRQLIEGATSAKSPALPTIVVVAVADADTQHVALATGVKFRVAGMNKFGKSTASVESAAVPLTSNQSYKITITEGGGANIASGYIIYRETAEGSGIFRQIKRIALTGSPMDYFDENADLPGTAKNFLCDLSAVGKQRAVSLAQLAPMHKLEYARSAPFRHGVSCWYVGTKWYAPQKFVMFKNCGVGKAQGHKLIDV